MNPFLKPERAETWQAGFNIDTRDLLVEQDALRFKALAYRSRIQNYIYSESYLVCSGGRKCSLPEVIGNGWEGISDEYSDNMYIYVNSASDVIAKGFELEMDYDAGFAFGRLSFSQQQTDQPTSIASTHFGAGDITELPRKYMTLDTGVRFFDNALTLGTIIKYTGKARRLSPDFEQDEHTGAIIKQDLPQIPTIIDLYGTYEYNRNLTLKLSVQNLMNRDYSEALNKLNMMPGLGDETHPANSARGRTWILVRTSDRLSFKAANAADSRFEHFRHMVYSQDSDTLFVSYSNMLKTAEGMKPLHKLLMLDGTTLALKGEVKDAYKGTAYGLTMDEKTQKIYVGGRDYINEIDAKNQTLLRTIPLKDPRPQITSVQNLAVDSASDRAFVVVFDHDDRSGTKDGLYIFDLRDGKQLGYVHTGAGANAVKYNPKYNELYVTNFTSGTISVVDATKYSITREFNMPVYPNQMVLSDDMDTLYIGIKEGFNRDWDPDVFVEGAKERILSIDLKKS